MMDWQGIPPITDGSGQRERMPAAFAPNYFDADEQSFEQLLAMGAEIAERLKYYNLANQVTGNWGELFAADEAVVMATILSIDLERMESDYRAIPYNQPEALVNFLLRLAAGFDCWYRHLYLAASKSKQATLLTHTIETLISDKLKTGFRMLERMVGDDGIEREVDLSGFADVWWPKATDDENSDPRATADTPPPGKNKHDLNETYYLFANAIGYLQKAASQHLQSSLRSQRHDPAIGLFMVFLRLFKKAQDRLNRFTPRHLDFYYRQVLEAGNLPRGADSYYLLLTAQAGAKKLRIDKNTAFSAGQDADLNEIIYRADESLLLSDVEVGSLLTLNLQQDRLISPESDVGFVTRIKTGRPALIADTTASDCSP